MLFLLLCICFYLVDARLLLGVIDYAIHVHTYTRTLHTRTHHMTYTYMHITYAHVSKICFIVFSVSATRTMHSVIHHFPSCMLLSQFNYLNILQSPYKTRTNRLLLAKQKPSRRRFRHLNTPFSAKQLRRSFDLPQDSSHPH